MISNAAVNESVVFTKNPPKQEIQVSIRELNTSMPNINLHVTINGVKKVSTGRTLVFDNLKAGVRYDIHASATGWGGGKPEVVLRCSVTPHSVTLEDDEIKMVGVDIFD